MVSTYLGRRMRVASIRHDAIVASITAPLVYATLSALTLSDGVLGGAVPRLPRDGLLLRVWILVMLPWHVLREYLLVEQ